MRIEQKDDGTYIKTLEPHEMAILEIALRIEQSTYERLAALERQVETLRQMLDQLLRKQSGGGA